MDVAQDFFDTRGSQWSLSSLKKFSTLSSPVQKHLQREETPPVSKLSCNGTTTVICTERAIQVYITLAAAVSIAAMGIWVHMFWNIGGLCTSFGFILTSMWLLATPSTEEAKGKRLRLLAMAAFLEGASMGTLVKVVLHFDPRIALVAFLGSVAIFICFSGAAAIAKRREYLFIGGLLSSLVSTMLILRLGSSFFDGQAFVNNVEIYGGLLVFVGYILFDTQMIIERANMGDFDYVKHALDLCVDFAAIFVRILVILTRNADDRQRRVVERRSGNSDDD